MQNNANWLGKCALCCTIVPALTPGLQDRTRKSRRSTHAGYAIRPAKSFKPNSLNSSFRSALPRACYL